MHPAGAQGEGDPESASHDQRDKAQDRRHPGAVQQSVAEPGLAELAADGPASAWAASALRNSSPMNVHLPVWLVLS
jgi:hypothetical protein